MWNTNRTPLFIILTCMLSCITFMTVDGNCLARWRGTYETDVRKGCDAGWVPDGNYFHILRCSRSVCAICYPGYYKSEWSHGYAISCSPCVMDGCDDVKCQDSIPFLSGPYCATSCNKGFYAELSFSPVGHRRSCKKCTPIDNCPDNEQSCTNANDQKCSKCDPGYFLESNGQKCTPCPKGSYCDGITRTPCWDPAVDRYYYCPYPKTPPNKVITQCPTRSLYGRNCDQSVKCVANYNQGKCAKDVCWSLRGNGKCSKCSHNSAGEACEHKVCLYSKLGQHLNEHYTKVPSEFNFTTYIPEDIQVSQVAESVFSLQVTYRPIAFDISRYQLEVNGVRENFLTSNFPPRCPSDPSGVPIMDKIQYPLQNDAFVGSTYNLCLRGNWKYESSMLTSGTWLDLKDGPPREEPISCLTYTLQFQSTVTFNVKDIFHTVPIENAVVSFYVLHKDAIHRYNATTNASGRVTANVIVPDVAKGVDELNLLIENVTPLSQDNMSRNFTICSSQPERGVACPENQMTLLNTTSHPISHLNLRGSQEIFIVDKSVVKVDGQLLHPGPNPASTDVLSCGIINATVNAIDGKSGELIQRTHTDGTGYFSIAVVRNTLLKLDFDYHNHTIGSQNDGNDFAEVLLLQNGITVSESITDLVFKDTTMCNITITGAVTDCMYDLGNYELELSVPSCPNVGTYSVLSEGKQSFFLQVPAHVYTWELKGFDGFGYQSPEGMNGYVDGNTVKERFNYMFPEASRTWDVTDLKEHNFTFTFHPSVEVSMVVVKGAYTPEVFPSSCHSSEYEGSRIPYDFAIKGNYEVQLNFYATQMYVNNNNMTYTCHELPDGFVLKLESDLGVSIDPCGANLGGCNSTFHMIDHSYKQSIAQATIISGNVTSYSNPYEENPSQNSKPIMDYVGSNTIRYTVLNERYYPADTRHEAGRGSAKILLLGEKQLTENTIVATLGKYNQTYPLLYLYSPPGENNEQTVTLEFSEILSHSIYSTYDNQKTNSGIAGVRATVNSEALLAKDMEFNLGFGGENIKLVRRSYEDTLVTDITSQSLTLSTSNGDDMVLIYGTVSTIEIAASVYFNETSCRVEEGVGVVWGNAQGSILYLSRSDCDRELDKLSYTINTCSIKLSDPNLSPEEREEQRFLKNRAEVERLEWLNIMDHWDEDRANAKLRKYYIPGENPYANPNSPKVHTFYIGSQPFSFSKTTSNSSSNLQTYDHSINVNSFIQITEGHILLGGSLFGAAKKLIGAFWEQEYHNSQIRSRTEKETREVEERKEITVAFNNEIDGNTICVEVYESPWSGTFVFEVCGGTTMCPHVPGTDARQKFKLYTKQTPLGEMQSDEGKILLEIDTLDIIDPNIEEIDLVVELAGETASSPVGFKIGSASLNQPLEFSVRTRQKQVLTIFFERLDTSVKRIDVVGSIRSKCDSNIRENFKYEIVWDSQCPSIFWGGSLKEVGSYLTLTQKNPMFQITAINPTGRRWRDYDDFKVEVGLYYREHNIGNGGWRKLPALNYLSSRVNGQSTTFIDIEDPSGSASIWITSEDNDLFVDGVIYEFYLATSCYLELSDGQSAVVGQVQTSIRLGAVDMNAPKIMSVTFLNEVEEATRNVHICSIVFNEPIDCTNPLLSIEVVTRTEVFGKYTFAKKKAVTYCTSQLQKLHVVLPLESLEEIGTWSQKNVTVSLRGIYDLFGNRFGDVFMGAETGNLTERRAVVDTPLTIDMFIPNIPNFDESKEEKELFTVTMMNTIKKDILTNKFPLNGIPSVSFFPDPEREFRKGNKTKYVVASSVSGLCVIALASYFILKYRKERKGINQDIPKGEKLALQLRTRMGQEDKIINKEHEPFSSPDIFPKNDIICQELNK